MVARTAGPPISVWHCVLCSRFLLTLSFTALFPIAAPQPAQTPVVNAPPAQLHASHTDDEFVLLPSTAQHGVYPPPPPPIEDEGFVNVIMHNHEPSSQPHTHPMYTPATTHPQPWGSAYSQGQYHPAPQQSYHQSHPSPHIPSTSAPQPYPSVPFYQSQALHPSAQPGGGQPPHILADLTHSTFDSRLARSSGFAASSLTDSQALTPHTQQQLLQSMPFELWQQMIQPTQVSIPPGTPQPVAMPSEPSPYHYIPPSHSTSSLASSTVSSSLNTSLAPTDFFGYPVLSLSLNTSR
jgi:hypothetical protein